MIPHQRPPLALDDDEKPRRACPAASSYAPGEHARAVAIAERRGEACGGRRNKKPDGFCRAVRHVPCWSWSLMSSVMTPATMPSITPFQKFVLNA